MLLRVPPGDYRCGYGFLIIERLDQDDMGSERSVGIGASIHEFLNAQMLHITTSQCYRLARPWLEVDSWLAGSCLLGITSLLVDCSSTSDVHFKFMQVKLT